VPKFFGYCRASTAGQEYSIEAQQKAITHAYESKYKPEGYEFGGFYEDKATSGGKPFTEREKGLALWIVAQKDDVVCWSKMDRAFRNVLDAASLLQMFQTKGVCLLSLDIALDTNTALGKFVMHLLASVAEMEREWIKARTRDALAIRQEKGLPHGGRPPAGWWKDKAGIWRPDEAERKVIEWAILQNNKGMSWKNIARLLIKKGINRANGHKYHQPFFHYALKARAAGYPVKDGWKEKCAYGGSIRREKCRPFRRKIKAALRQQTSTCPDGTSESSSQSEGPSQTDGQTPGN
jgi:DNA invertase Pin-like site-specific DNA recombinase